ncbi:MAG: DUF5681 domain-containing protein [Thermomicrobiales bacterium]
MTRKARQPGIPSREPHQSPSSSRKAAPRERAPRKAGPSRSKDGRFEAGHSGNDKGRPKGSKNKRTIIIEMMEAKLGRKIRNPNKLSRYEGVLLKGIQKALGGDIRAMGFVLTEYRKAIEASGSATAAATEEEDSQAFNALCAKLRRELEHELRATIRNEKLKEIKK